MLSILILVSSLILSTVPEQVYAELQLLSTTRTFALNGTQNNLEVRLTSNQSAVSIQAVMVSLNSSTENARLSIGDISAYDKNGNEYAIRSGQPPQFTNTSQMLDNQIVPVTLPAGGSMGLKVHVADANMQDALEITVVYVTGTLDDIGIVFIPLMALPFDVVEKHGSLEILGSATGEAPVKVENAFTDPEIHCEVCTRVEFQPNASSNIDVAYVSNSTDLSSADRMFFWAMGEGDVVFNIAGRNGPGDDVSYAKTLEVSLDNEWRKVEIDLSGANLDSITHLFGFSMDGANDQTFYLKGISYG